MGKKRLEALLRQLVSGKPDLQVSAISQLVEYQSYDAAPEIAKLLESSDNDVRERAAEALGFLGQQAPEIYGPQLLRLLDDENPLVRANTAEALGRLSYRDAHQQVEDLLHNDTDQLVRATAAETLGFLGEIYSLKALFSALTDQDESVRAYAARSIGMLGNSELLPRIEESMLKESSLRVKAELLAASVCFGESTAVNSLLELFKKADEHLTMCLLIILEYLLSQRLSPTLTTEDVSNIRSILDSVADRFPITKLQIKDILAGV